MKNIIILLLSLFSIASFSQQGLDQSKVKKLPDSLLKKVNKVDFNGLFDTRLGTKTTSNLTEGLNLYWTNARGDARYPLLSGSYLDPSWLSLSISKTTGLQSALDLKAPLTSPTFIGTVSGITKSMVGLPNVDNTSDINKPISTA